MSVLLNSHADAAHAITSIDGIGSCPDQSMCSNVTFGEFADVGWGESFTVSVNASGWCSSEIGADDINGLSIKETYPSLGGSHPQFQDTSPPGASGVHTGVITWPEGATGYWIQFSTVCGFTGINGAFFVESWTKVFEVVVAPRPLAAPSNIKVTPHDTSYLVTWNSVPNAQRYVVSLAGVHLCDTVSTSCLVSDQTTGSIVSGAKITAINNQYSTAFWNGVSEIPPFRVAEPVAITGGVSGVMKVGSSLVFNVLTVGTLTYRELSWFRCDSAQLSIHAFPNCSRLPSASGSTYQITSSDLGKFIVPFINAGNSWSGDMYTPGNSIAVVAADAITPAPPVDPTGKPLINDISSRELADVGGSTIVLTGSNLESVSKVTIDGLDAKIVNVSETSLTIIVPARPGKTGLVDLALTSPRGTTVATNALGYVEKVVITYPTKISKITGFSAVGFALTTAQKTAIKKLIASGKGYLNLSCIGDVTGVKSSTFQRSLALKRAVASCAYAKSLNKYLKVKTSGRQSRVTGAIQRYVSLTLTR